MTLTAGKTTILINDGNDGDDKDFIEAGSGGGFDDNIVLRGEESGGEESGQGEEHGDLLEGVYCGPGCEQWKGRVGMQVLQSVFATKHASRALRHVLKIRKSDIMICKAAIPERYRKRYLDLYKADTECPFGTRSIQFHTLQC